MESVAIGTKVFKRPEKLAGLLDSIPSSKIDHVYIADDSGENYASTVINQIDAPFEYSIIELDYDAGNGYSRAKIVEHLSENYLLMLDADHRVPENIEILYQQLSRMEQVGGIAGSIVEPEKKRMWQSGKQFIEEHGGLVRTAEGSHPISSVARYPFVEFDFVPQAILLKSECVADYAWDKKYVTRREHLDFFVGHWKQTDWTFGVSPAVIFEHYPGGSAEYSSHRKSESKHKADDEYFLKKWGYSFVEMNEPYWFDTKQTTVTKLDKFKRRLRRLLRYR